MDNEGVSPSLDDVSRRKPERLHGRDLQQPVFSEAERHGRVSLHSNCHNLVIAARRSSSSLICWIRRCRKQRFKYVHLVKLIDRSGLEHGGISRVDG